MNFWNWIQASNIGFCLKALVWHFLPELVGVSENIRRAVVLNIYIRFKECTVYLPVSELLVYSSYLLIFICRSTSGYYLCIKPREVVLPLVRKCCPKQEFCGLKGEVLETMEKLSFSCQSSDWMMPVASRDANLWAESPGQCRVKTRCLPAGLLALPLRISRALSAAQRLPAPPAHPRWVSGSPMVPGLQISTGNVTRRKQS